jgi:hypothetical protein
VNVEDYFWGGIERRGEGLDLFKRCWFVEMKEKGEKLRSRWNIFYIWLVI